MAFLVGLGSSFLTTLRNSMFQNLKEFNYVTQTEPKYKWKFVYPILRRSQIIRYRWYSRTRDLRASMGNEGHVGPTWRCPCLAEWDSPFSYVYVTKTKMKMLRGKWRLTSFNLWLLSLLSGNMAWKILDLLVRYSSNDAYTHTEIREWGQLAMAPKISENPLQFEKNLHLASNFFYLHNGPKQNFLAPSPRRIGVGREIWMMMI